MRLLSLMFAAAMTVRAVEVSGRIQYSPDIPLIGASITLMNERDGIRRTARSDSNGHYVIAGVPAGTPVIAGGSDSHT